MSTPNKTGTPDLDLLCINTIRTLAMDAVQKANSGHPGTPMSLAPLAYALYTRHLRHDPRHPDWPDRDRFVLSCGHASMLLYAALYLAGYDLSLEDLRQFRQWGSRTPGHPEHGLTPGVETTTGPLGQGFANGVGMAIAEASLAARFNRPGHEIVNHRTYAIASDGDLMEGISHEAASLAGHLRLGKLIYCYDDNHITIEGSTDLAFSEDVAQRFAGYGWHVVRVADGNDLAAIDAAIGAAQAETARPSLVIVRTHIAWGSPHKQDTAEAPSKMLRMRASHKDPRNRKFERKTVPAMDLHGIVGAGPGHARGEELRHACLKIAAFAGILLPRREIRELACDHELDCHHRDFVGDAREIDDRHPELLALLRVAQGLLHGCLRDPDRTGSGLDARGFKSLHQLPKAKPLNAAKVLGLRLPKPSKAISYSFIPR